MTDRSEPLCTIRGYELICENRRIITKGGVALYVTDMFTAKKLSGLGIHVEGEFETVFAEVRANDKTLVVGEIYRIPNTNEKLSLERFEYKMSLKLKLTMLL